MRNTRASLHRLVAEPSRGVRPLALRPRLTAGLPFSVCGYPSASQHAALRPPCTHMRTLVRVRSTDARTMSQRLGFQAAREGYLSNPFDSVTKHDDMAARHDVRSFLHRI